MLAPLTEPVQCKQRETPLRVQGLETLYSQYMLSLLGFLMLGLIQSRRHRPSYCMASEVLWGTISGSIQVGRAMPDNRKG